MAYPGGKAGAGVTQQIINQIPPHRVYIEPFLGGGAVLKAKRPAEISIGLDMDPQVIADWALAGYSGFVSRGNAIDFLQAYDFKGNEFVYLDPPYLMETRSCKRPLYRYEFSTPEEHEALLKLIISLPCMVAISGYMSPLYKSILATWRTISYTTRTRGGASVQEWLWMNYPEPVELHDYRFLGDNFRERERLKRIRTRWLARLGRMDRLERYALLSSISEYSEMIKDPNLVLSLNSPSMATLPESIAINSDTAGN